MLIIFVTHVFDTHAADIDAAAIDAEFHYALMLLITPLMPPLFFRHVIRQLIAFG